jgi:hypothetical protein
VGGRLIIFLRFEICCALLVLVHGRPPGGQIYRFADLRNFFYFIFFYFLAKYFISARKMKNLQSHFISIISESGSPPGHYSGKIILFCGI